MTHAASQIRKNEKNPWVCGFVVVQNVQVRQNAISHVEEGGGIKPTALFRLLMNLRGFLDKI